MSLKLNALGASRHPVPGLRHLSASFLASKSSYPGMHQRCLAVPVGTVKDRCFSGSPVNLFISENASH